MNPYPTNTIPTIPNTNSNIKMIPFAGTKVSRASFCVLLAGITVSILLAIFLPLPLPVSILIAIYVLLMALLAAYNVNCVQVGHCKVWAWILTGLYIFSVAISALVLLMKNDEWANIYMPKASNMPVEKGLKSISKSLKK